jgi:hypothetical protein
MINETAAIAEDRLRVIDGITLNGSVNVTDDCLLENVRRAIRRPYPQVRPQPITSDRIALVGGGPSLKDTERELVDLVQSGAKLVTMNGAYQWCLERNLFPKTQIVMDARPSNARFLMPAAPGCNYLLASQCAPEVWDAVEGRPNVWMFHAAAGADGPLKDLLDAHYLGQWFGVGGGTTVATRALSVLRTLGYVRFDLFGVDSCFLHGAHHAYAQPENSKDRPIKFWVEPPGRPDLRRVFDCAPWHVKQAEDFLQMVRINGEQFLLNVHGDGMIAYMMRSAAVADGEVSCGEL